MSRPINLSDTLTTIPSSFDSINSSYDSVYSNLEPDNRWVEQSLSYMSDNNIKYLKQGDN